MSVCRCDEELAKILSRHCLWGRGYTPGPLARRHAAARPRCTFDEVGRVAVPKTRLDFRLDWTRSFPFRGT